jgi:hypothetical protein
MADDHPSLLSRRTLLLAGTAALVAGCGSEDARKEVPPATAGGTGFWYTVQRGDELGGGAARARVSPADIVVVNSLGSLALVPGQRLWIPGVLGFASAGPASAPAEPDPEAVVEAAAGGYKLVPRSAWAREAVKGNNNPMGKVLRLTVHHTGEHAGLVGLPDVEVIQRIEHYHRSPKPSGRGWACIGYHYLVGKDGRVYEGRPAQYQGAHVSGANENNLGISVIGDFMNRLPSPAQLAALTAFVADMQRKYQVPARCVHGHRDLGSSECPGDRLYAWLRGKGFAGRA